MNRRGFRIAIGVLIAAAVALSFFADAPVERWVRAHQNADVKQAAKLVSKYGAWQWLMGFCVIWLAIAALRRNQKWKRALVAMLIAASIAGVLADTTRMLGGRTRPNAAAPQGWYGVRTHSQW